MPYTTNVAGTTITAAWGNANVRDQVVTPFATAAARTSAISAPVQCMLSARTDVNVVEGYDGAAWQVLGYLPSFLFARRTSDASSVASSTVLADDTQLSVTVAANAVYAVVSHIIYTADAAGDLQIGWSGPAGATFNWSIGGAASTAAGTTASAYFGQNSLSGSDVVGGTGTSTGTIARPTGLLVTAGASGLFKFRWAQGTSSVNGTQVRQDSHILLFRVA